MYGPHTRAGLAALLGHPFGSPQVAGRWPSTGAQEGVDELLTEDPETGAKGRIGILRIEGGLQRRPGYLNRIFGEKRGPYEQITTEVERFMADERFVGLAYTVSSFGGEPDGVANATGAILRAVEHFGGRVWSLAQGTANSAAYPILAAAGAGRVYAEPGAFVGSINVWLAMKDASALFEQMGVRVIKATGKDGDLKAPGSPEGVEITEAQVEWANEQADLLQDEFFLPLVAQARSVTIAQAREMADRGQSYAATEAQRRGLIDGILTEADFFRLVTNAAQETPMAAIPGRDTPTTPPPVEPDEAQAQAAPVIETAAPAADPPGETPAPAVAAALAPAPAAPAPAQGGNVALAAPPNPAPGIADLMALVERQGAQIAAQGAQITELVGQLQTNEAEGRAARFRSRLQVASLPPGQADTIMANVERQIEQGLADREIEPIVAGFEGLEREDPTALLRAEIPLAGGETTTVDLRAYQDRGGRLSPEARARGATIETIRATAKSPREEFEAMSQLVAAQTEGGAA